jgi:RHS repeat-associated protein
MTTSTSVHSNAFNFMSFLQNGVDPRTGQYTISINLPDVKTNDLRGPGVPLPLVYNPLNTQNSGFGLGWNLQLSQYTPGNQMLSLSTGETFKITGTVGDQLDMKEKKLDSFHFYKESEARYRVMHKSGLVEILEVLGNAQNRVALPVEIHAPEGHKVTLDYKQFGSAHMILSSIKDDAGQTLLLVNNIDTSVEVLLQPYAGPDGGPLARFVMTLGGSDRRVSKITLPTENEASWRFGYFLKNGHLCISSVETPTGAREEIEYKDLGHQFPAGGPDQPLPRVTDHRTYPGFGQPTVDVRYTYKNDKSEEPNFLGFGLPLNWLNDGTDNLYRHIGSYEYVSVETLWVEGQAARAIERKFNQFHLLTRETTTQNNHVQTVDSTYHLTDGVSFEQQPRNFQLPKEVKTTWSISNNPLDRSESVRTTYDIYGNLLDQTQANGIVETSTWYPAEGADGCPPDPEGFVRQMKDQTITPAAPNGKAPILRTTYRYKALPALAGSELKNWLTVERQTLVQLEGIKETELQRTVFEHTNDPTNPFLHGRVKQQTVTMNSKPTITAYAYSKLDSPELKESVLQTVETLTGFDHGLSGKNVEKVITLQRSLLTGQDLLNLDDNDVEIRYTYDPLRRVIRETVAPGKPSEAFRRYEYSLCANTGDQAEQWLFDVKAVKTCTRFDGLNRAIYEERDDADTPGRVGVPRQTYAATYDAWGNLSEETEHDWLGEEKRVLTSRFEYDDWGQQRCVTGPDGVKTYEETDPIGTDEWKGPIQRSWREGSGPDPMVSGVTETWLNLFEKPARTERFDLASNRVSLHQYQYDGLGRTTEESVGFGNVVRKTLYSYDYFDRMIETTLPGNAVVRREYAEHSQEDLPTSITVNGKLLGLQVFDGLDRMIESTTGGRKQLFSFEPGQTQPKTVTTPSGQVIEYDYQPELGTEPVRRRLPVNGGAKGEFEEGTYEYDPKNARLTFCEEQGIALTREYFSTGEIKSEKRVGEVGEYTMHYRYSRLGRLIGYIDVLGQEQSYQYDDKARLERTQLSTTTSTFTYDSLGQTATINTSDGGQRVGITLKYDEFGRETLRTFDLNGVSQELKQVYNDVDGLKQRTLTEGAEVLRDESYEYDPRGRLTKYTCTGTQPPIDPYGKAIMSQLFVFDALDNLTAVVTAFSGGSNRATYKYSTQDPAQLASVTNTHECYPPEIKLFYSLDGHLISDEVGRTLEYDALGRLTDVSGLPGETPSHYRYDPLNTVVGQDDEQRYYQDGELATRIQGEQRNTVMRANGNALAERQEGADPKYLMLASDHKNSVLCEVSQAGRKGIAYTAYGEAMVSGSLGYNGEARESQTGRYLLGNGYRAYNPVLMRFHSPDSLSPFEEGGLNSYMYCEGNPVDFVDPSGNRSFFAWLRDTLFSKSPKPIPKSAPKPTSKSAPNTATLVSSPAKSSKHESKPTFDNRGFNELPKWPTIWKQRGSQDQLGRTMVERMPSSTGQGSNLLGGFNGRDDVEFTSSRSPRANISKPSPKRRAKTQDPKAARTEKTVQQLRDEKWAANQKIEDIRRIEGRKQ